MNVHSVFWFLTFMLMVLSKVAGNNDAGWVVFVVACIISIINLLDEVFD